MFHHRGHDAGDRVVAYGFRDGLFACLVDLYRAQQVAARDDAGYRFGRFPDLRIVGVTVGIPKEQALLPALPKQQFRYRLQRVLLPAVYGQIGPFLRERPGEVLDAGLVNPKVQPPDTDCCIVSVEQ